MTEKMFRWFFIFLFLSVVVLTKDMYILNTGDFMRVTFPFINSNSRQLIEITSQGSLVYPLKLDFSSPVKYFKSYPSSFSFLTYFYAFIISIFTDFYDLRVFSLVGKAIFCIGALKLTATLIDRKKHPEIFCIGCLSFIVLLIRPYAAFYNSFYQEQVILYALPWLIIGFYGWYYHNKWICLAAAVAAITLSKSQFFILPCIVIVAILICRGLKGQWRLMVGLSSIQILAIIFILLSSGATPYNKYHAAYFGVYLYDKFDNSGSLYHMFVKEDDCVGVDAWGNQYNLHSGANHTDLGGRCFEENKDISFKRVLEYVIANPKVIMAIYQESFQRHVVLDYYHVYDSYKLLQGNQIGVLQVIENLGQKYLAHYRPLISALLMLSLFFMLFFKRSLLAATVWLLATFALSQAYISFFGEGYRDLSKHLFPMHYSFDMMLLLCWLFVIGKISELFGNYRRLFGSKSQSIEK